MAGLRREARAGALVLQSDNLKGRHALAVALTFSVAAAAEAQQRPISSQASPQTVRAVRVASPPSIDGRLTEDEWARAEVADQFTQRDPDEGQPATERTEIRVLYDDDAIYVGARLFDREPAKIARRLSNRDDSPDADHIVIYFDPRHDRVTGVEFLVSAAGVQRDAVISNDTNEDSSWDAVWASAVAVDDQGWSAELRIPFSQVRFTAADSQVWGINVSRFIQRKNETSWLQLVPKNENGLASRMIQLVGIDGVRPGRHLELAPYTAARQEFIQPVRSGDPFNDGSRVFGSIGLDLKARVTNSLTLDATVNPDFGQAEVDPAVVNLSAFETFFDEKRRFFIEGSEIFNNFGTGGSNNFFGFNTSDPNIFYSRRIGRPPQGQADGDFVDLPHATTILGAVKLTGKTPSGWSVGILNALTGREHARVVGSDGSRSTVEVEPPTNYFVGRLQRIFSRGGAGFLTTSVLRNLQTPWLTDHLTRRAFVFGGDAFYFFDKKHDWVVTGKLSGSHVSGTEAAIAELQLAPQRYYQRPDAPEVSFDPHRRSLSGYAGRVNLNRNSGVWQVNAALWGVSPGFESNDLGFLGSGDRAGGHGVLMWRKTTQDRFTRARNWWIAKAWNWNFDRRLLNNLWFGCGSATFTNYWSVNGCASHAYRVLDDRLTRGGPLTLGGSGRGANAGFSTDSRKRLSLNLSGGRDWDEFGGWSTNNEISITIKPISSMDISTGPQLNRSHTPAQYVGTETDPAAVDTFGKRYIFAAIDQTQLTLTTRVNWVMTPRASLRVFMQPLLATGAYKGFKQLARPETFDFLQFQSDASFVFSQDPITRAYTIDAGPSGQTGPYTFDNPDFNFKSLRLNAVFRWEFVPGSTLYAVWTEQREDFSHPGQFRLGRDASRLFSAPANDIFLVKMTYWIGK